jgi:acetolactate synthase-1/2/3 large subunit
MFRNGGSYLGWALGAAAGFGLAGKGEGERQRAGGRGYQGEGERQRAGGRGAAGDIPVAVCGDGSFIFAVPTAVLWFARTHQIPVLTVVLNNATYNSVRLAGRDGYPDGAQVRHGYVGSDFGETPHADEVARACGVAGFRASDGEQFRSVLKQAVETVQAGQPALVTVDTTAADRAT